MIHFQLTNSTPVALPKLKRLEINLSNCNESFGITLMTWFMLAPNIEELNLIDMMMNDKIKLAIELDDLLKANTFARPPIFDRLVQVKLVYGPSNSDLQSRQKLFSIFSKIFPKAIDFIRKNCLLTK